MKFLFIILAFFMASALPSRAWMPHGAGVIVAPPPSDWYNSAWGYRKTVTIDHTKVSSSGGETYVNFPVLVSEASDSNLAAHAQTNGNDILFVAVSSPSTKLPHEIEQYTSGTGALQAWVQVQGLSTTVDTQLYIYYGNSLAPNQQNVAGTWDSHFKGVYHLASTNTQFSMSRYSGYPVVNYGGTGSWDYSQVYDPNIMVDPSNSSQLIMFYTGMAAPVALGQECIGRATAPVSNPYSWTPYFGNPIICNGTNSNRADSSTIYTGGTFYLFSTNDQPPGGGGNNFIELWTSTDGFSFSLAGTVLTATGQGRNDGFSVSQGAVYYDGTTWTMIYSYRVGSSILPGYRYATSTTGLPGSWTKQGAGDILTQGVSGTWDSSYMDNHQIYKIGSTFVLLYSSFNQTQFWNGIATAPSVSGPYTKNGGNPLQEASQTPGAFDQYHVATPAFFQVGSTWYLMYSGANVFSPYSSARWAMGMETLAGTPLDAVPTGITDSTGNNSLVGTAMTAITGQMDGAFNFDGATGHASSNTAATAVTSGYTVEAWVNPANLSQAGLFVLNGLNALSTGGTGFGLGQGDGSGNAGAHLEGLASSIAWTDSGYSFPTANVWYSTAMRNAGGTTSFMVNGSATSGTGSTTPAAASGGFSIGQQPGTPTYAGGIDEVRISAIARSTEWLSTEYNNQSAPGTFMTIGAEVPY